MTRYVILDKATNGEWRQSSEVEARSGESAIRAYLNGADDREGTFVAVPARSWKPVTVKVETKTALKFS